MNTAYEQTILTPNYLSVFARLGFDDDIKATSSISLAVKMSVGDIVYVSMKKEGNHGDSR